MVRVDRESSYPRLVVQAVKNATRVGCRYCRCGASRSLRYTNAALREHVMVVRAQHNEPEGTVHTVQQPHSAAVRVYAHHSPEVDDIAQDGQRQQEHQQLTDTGGVYIVSEVQDTWTQ